MVKATGAIITNVYYKFIGTNSTQTCDATHPIQLGYYDSYGSGADYRILMMAEYDDDTTKELVGYNPYNDIATSSYWHITSKLILITEGVGTISGAAISTSEAFKPQGRYIPVSCHVSVYDNR